MEFGYKYTYVYNILFGYRNVTKSFFIAFRMNSHMESDIKHEEHPRMITEIKSEPQVSYKFLYMLETLFYFFPLAVSYWLNLQNDIYIIFWKISFTSLSK